MQAQKLLVMKPTERVNEHGIKETVFAKVESQGRTGIEADVMEIKAGKISSTSTDPKAMLLRCTGNNKHTYRMGGMTCLAGDFMGDYSFDEPLKIGDSVVFDDMIHYTMVKTTTFNGVGLPSIGIWKENDEFQLLKSFGYETYKDKL